MTDQDKALHIDHLVMRESPAVIWRYEEEVMTEREQAIWHAAYIAGQHDIQARFMKVMPRNSVYRRWLNEE